MIEVKNGRFTGTVEIPVDRCSVYAVLKYGKLETGEFMQYSTPELAKMLGMDIRSVRTAVADLHKVGNHLVLKKGTNGGNRGHKKMTIKTVEQHDGFQGKLVRLMIANHENCTTLAQKIGVHHNSVSRWVQKGVIPETRNLKKIADHYNVQMAWLTGETRNPMRRY